MTGTSRTDRVVTGPDERAVQPDAGDRFPLSHAQQGMWFIERADGPSGMYTVPVLLRMNGPLDRAALCAAVNDLVAHHETLRTVFGEDDGVPYQQVLPLDRAHCAVTIGTVTQATLCDAIAAARRHQFDLCRELPLRADLLVLGPERHVLLLLIHHIAVDGQSLAVLLSDLEIAYGARLAGAAPVLPAGSHRYADFIHLQADMLGDPRDPHSVSAAELAYWTSTLRGAPEQIPLPADFSGGGRTSNGGDSVGFRLPAALHSRLASLARDERATMFMVLHAGVATLLHRLGAGPDIVLGSPVAGRIAPEFDTLVGLFANTLVLRLDLAGDPTYREVIRRARTVDLAAYLHQQVAFEQVVGALSPARSARRSPLVQVMLTFHNGPLPRVRMSGLRVGVELLDLDDAKVELSFHIVERRGANGACLGIDAAVVYAVNRFSRATARWLASAFRTLLAAAATRPDRPVSRLPIPLDTHRRQRVDAANRTQRTSAPAHLTQLVEARVATAGASPATIHRDAVVTYAELNARANQLARLLVLAGVGAEDTVGLAVPRSVDMLVAVLGTVKAGAAYLPLDTDGPPARLKFMVADASPPVVVSTTAAAAALPPGPTRLLLDDPQVAAALRDASARDLTDGERIRPLNPANAAYVTYTSGSTGRPKGVVVSHAALTERLRWLQATYPLTPADRVMLKTPLSFDVSAREIFAPLLAGAALVIAEREAHSDPAAVARLITSTGVTVVHFVPTLLRAFLDAVDRPRCRSLRRVICSGEALDAQLSTRFKRLLDAELNVSYGPAEAGVNSTFGIADPDSQPGGAPIGQPTWNTRVYVLDPWLRPVPVGVAGEAYIAGTGLARGYLNRPSRTAERFVADPFADPGCRMYRSGDLVRWHEDGTLAYLGRTDQQIKIRGVRIEPAEVEAILAAHDDVSAAAVAVSGSPPTGLRLVAYVVPRPGAVIDAAELRAHAYAHLPAAMVPSAAIFVDELPLQLNGKVDRAALLEPVTGIAAVHDGPTTPTEELLCGLFAETLGLPDVGVDEDFFSLGGHSLLALVLASRASGAFGLDLPVATVFEAPTVAALARRLHQTLTSPPAPVPVRRPNTVPLSFSQRRLWFLHQLEGPNSTYNVPYLLHLEGQLDRSALEAALLDVVTRHEPLRTILPASRGVPRQVVLAPRTARPELHLVQVAGADLDAACRDYASYEFDLTSQPPLRTWLLSGGPDRHALLMLVHHVATDGWSAGPLLRDLARAYHARAKGRAPAWAPLPVQYADYALWQHDLLDRGFLASQLNHWLDTLNGAPARIPLLMDHVPPDRPGRQATVVALDIDAALHRHLLRLARQSRTTLFMVVHAALAAALTGLGCGTDIVIGAPTSGRNSQVLHDLVGCFVNVLVLRCDTSGDPAFRELLAQVREVDLAAYANQDLPFECLVEALNPPRSLSHHPIYQVVLTMHTSPSIRVDLPGLVTRTRLTGDLPARVDIAVSLTADPHHGGGPTGMTGALVCRADVFGRSTAEEIAARIRAILEAVAATPDLTLSRLG